MANLPTHLALQMRAAAAAGANSHSVVGAAGLGSPFPAGVATPPGWPLPYGLAAAAWAQHASQFASSKSPILSSKMMRSVEKMQPELQKLARFCALSLFVALQVRVVCFVIEPFFAIAYYGRYVRLPCPLPARERERERDISQRPIGPR